MLKAANSECSSVESLADFWRSPCILPAAEKTRSTPAEEAGAAKYCLTILASAGHLDSLACHQTSRLTSRSVSSGSVRYSLSQRGGLYEYTLNARYVHMKRYIMGGALFNGSITKIH